MQHRQIDALFELADTERNQGESVEEHATREAIAAIHAERPLDRKELGLAQMAMSLARNIALKNAKGTAIAHEVTAYQALMERLIGDQSAEVPAEVPAELAAVVEAFTAPPSAGSA